MRKISAHYIFTNVSFPLKFGILHIDDNGKIIDIIDTRGNLKEEANLEFYNGIICPGFVNTHCHLELSHIKNQIPIHAGLVNFIKQVIKERGTKTLEEKTQAIQSADKEMVKNGIIAVSDVSNNLDSLNTKLKSNIYYHTFFEIFGSNEEKAGEIYTNAINYINQFKKNNQSCSLSPHATYSVSKNLFQLIHKRNLEKQDILSIHNQESQKENDLFQQKNNDLKEFISSAGTSNLFDHCQSQSPLQSVFQFINNALKVLLVHNTFTTEKDLKYIQPHQDNVYWVLCPNSNLYIENTLPPVNLIRKYSKNIAIGTDSYASNTTLSVLEELKTISSHFTDVGFEELIKWGTLNGAKALNISDRFGSLEIGKTPGIILLKDIDLTNLKLTRKTSVKVLN